MKYYFNKTLAQPFDTVKEKVLNELKTEGFGVLTEIDVQATLKMKLDIDFYKYEILGACNPKLAYQALLVEDKVGTMLPCNVILQQKNPSGSVEVSAVDPFASMQAIENDKLSVIAKQVQEKLQTIIERL